MDYRRRQFLKLAAGAVVLPTAASIARADVYPSRPVHVVLGLPPGATPDIVARLSNQWLSQRLGQSFFVDNRPGAGSNLATEAVVRATPDGYTLLFVQAGNAINVSMYPNANFDFLHDIAPVASIGRTPFVLVVHPSIPAKTVPEFIAYAKANPGKINMASPGIGAANHVFGELFQMMTGVEMVHVPYRGSLYPDLLAGQVQVLFGAVPALIANIQASKLRALAVTTKEPVEALPGVPPMNDFVPGYEASGWVGLAAPRDTPADIVDKLNKEIGAFDADPEMKSKLVELGIIPMSTTSAEFEKFVAGEAEKWAKVVKFANIKAE
jgi:tripartite-type tricarboxylate transporter receptor subunit TctC